MTVTVTVTVAVHRRIFRTICRQLMVTECDRDRGRDRDRDRTLTDDSRRLQASESHGYGMRP